MMQSLIASERVWYVLILNCDPAWSHVQCVCAVLMFYSLNKLENYRKKLLIL